MPSPKSKPYITAFLTSANPILDLSGKHAFTLTITLMLHASAPVLCYTDIYDTFFLPRNALTDVGIIFRHHHTKEEIRLCHIDSCRTPGFARRLTEVSRLYLEPERPVVFEVPFAINSEKAREDKDFDPWVASITSEFQDGGVYEAALPLYRTLDWWRYATSSDLHNTSTDSGTSSITARIRSAVDVMIRSDKRH